MATPTPNYRLPERPLDPPSHDHAGYCPECGGYLEESTYRGALLCMNEECGHEEGESEDPRIAAYEDSMEPDDWYESP